MRKFDGRSLPELNNGIYFMLWFLLYWCWRIPPLNLNAYCLFNYYSYYSWIHSYECTDEFISVILLQSNLNALLLLLLLFSLLSLLSLYALDEFLFINFIKSYSKSLSLCFISPYYVNWYSYKNYYHDILRNWSFVNMRWSIFIITLE